MSGMSGMSVHTGPPPSWHSGLTRRGRGGPPSRGGPTRGPPGRLPPPGRGRPLPTGGPLRRGAPLRRGSDYSAFLKEPCTTCEILNNTTLISRGEAPIPCKPSPKLPGPKLPGPKLPGPTPEAEVESGQKCTECESLRNLYLKQEGKPEEPCESTPELPTPIKSGCGKGSRIPVWACGILTEEDIDPKCTGQEILTPECLGEAVYREVMAADAYAHTEHTEGAESYNKAVEAYTKETDVPKKALKKTQLLKNYPESHVTIEGVKYAVPNPYMAGSVRESYGGAPATFFNPNPNPTETSFKAKVRSQNAALINNLSFDDILLDKDMTISFLDALWFCGRNPILEGERCTPARAIALLREFEQVKHDGLRYKESKEATKNFHWNSLKSWMNLAMKQFETDTFDTYVRQVSASSVSGTGPVVDPVDPVVQPQVVKPVIHPVVQPVVDPDPVHTPKPDPEADRKAREAREAREAAERAEVARLAREAAARKHRIPLNIPIINPGFRPGLPLRPTPGLGFLIPLAKGL